MGTKSNAAWGDRPKNTRQSGCSIPLQPTRQALCTSSSLRRPEFLKKFNGAQSFSPRFFEPGLVPVPQPELQLHRATQKVQDIDRVLWLDVLKVVLCVGGPASVEKMGPPKKNKPKQRIGPVERGWDSVS